MTNGASASPTGLSSQATEPVSRLGSDELQSLARRCEEAAGADRELDGLIEVVRDPLREIILYNKPGPFPQKAVRGPVKDLVLTGADLADYTSAPRYTTSLDAAMTLVDGAWHPQIVKQEDGDWRTFIGTTTPRQGQAGNAPTAALAICAAALRAIAIETQRAETVEQDSVAKR